MHGCRPTGAFWSLDRLSVDDIDIQTQHIQPVDTPKIDSIVTQLRWAIVAPRYSRDSDKWSYPEVLGRKVPGQARAPANTDRAITSDAAFLALRNYAILARTFAIRAPRSICAQTIT